MIKHIHRQVRKARYIVYKETLVNYREHFWTFLGSFFGIGFIGLVSSEYFTAYDNLFMVGAKRSEKRCWHVWDISIFLRDKTLS